MRNTQRATLILRGLGCGGAHSLERRIARVPGVTAVYVNPATELAYVDYDPDNCELAAVAAAVERAGYGVAEQAEGLGR